MNPTTHRIIGHRTIGWAAAAGTLPYLTLKAIWLAGGSTGALDVALVHSPAMAVLNGVTALLDLVVIALALALTHPVGRRLPGWLVLLPMWVGTGLLLPVTVGLLPATLLAGAGSGGDFLEPWVRPVVYGGFAWQAVFLLVAFVLHARSRWSEVVTAPSSRSPLLHVTAAGGVVLAVVSAVLHLVLAVTLGSAAGAVGQLSDTGFAVLGAAGVVALVRGTAHRWAAVTAAWTGSAALFAWGLWATAITVTGTPLGVPDPVGGAASLTGLLGGFALAVAALLTLPLPAPSERGSTIPTRRVRHLAQ